MFENADAMHLMIIVATIVFAIIFVILKVLDSRNQRHKEYVDRKGVMERYRRKIKEIRATKAAKKAREEEENDP